MNRINPAPEKWNAITDRLAESTSRIRYGSVTAELKIHDGRIVAVTYSVTENTREVER